MADGRLVVIVPTRSRPGRAAGLLDACMATCTDRTWLLLAVDQDDPTADQYDQLMAEYPRTMVHRVTEPAGHVGAINAGARMALDYFGDRAAGLAKLDDDHRPRSAGWDTQYLAALRELGTGIVYGNDLLQGERLPTAPAMTADIVQALDWMAPPALRHLYCDDFWRDLGQGAGCLRYLPQVIVEHMHPAAGKAAMDDGYRRANAPERYRDDGAAYEAYKASQLAADVAKVRALREVTSCP